MILYDFRCPVDGLDVEQDGVPLVQKGTAIPAGKHVHLEINQEMSCANGHTFTVSGSLLLHRSV